MTHLSIPEHALPAFEAIAASRGYGSAQSYFDSIMSGPSPAQGLAELANALAEQELTADMASFRKKTTGLDNTVFVSVAFPGHQPRIKVAVEPRTHIDPFGKSASVAIDDGRILAGELLPLEHRAVRDWLELNRNTLLDYWHKRISTDELEERLRKLPD